MDRGGEIMQSERHQPNPAKPTSPGGAELHGAVLRIPRDGALALSVTPEGVEIALSAKTVAELSSMLQGKAPFRNYHTVSEEAERIGLSEKTVRNLLKEKHAPHFVIGSDIRIDPIAMDEWMNTACAAGKPNPSTRR